MLIAIDQEPYKLTVSYVKSDGSIGLKSWKTQPWIWEICDENDPERSTEFRNWDDAPVKKIMSKQFRDLGIREFLTQHISKEDQQEIFAFHKPKMFSVDIEIDIRKSDGAFPDPSKADYPIYSISITAPDLSTIILSLDQHRTCENSQEIVENMLNDYFRDNKYFKQILDKHKKTKLSYKQVFFDTEEDMLRFYFEKQRTNLHTIHGWNWFDFDQPYINNRAAKLGIDRSIGSPVGKCVGGKGIADPSKNLASNRFHDKYRASSSAPMHRLELDAMVLYSSYNWILWKNTVALWYVAKGLLDISKVHYEGSFTDLLVKEPFEKYLMYNAVDTILVAMIEEIYSNISVALMRAHYCRFTIDKHASTMAIGDALFSDRFYEEGKIYAGKKEYIEEAKTYEGGYVKTPARPIGEYVVLLDYKSLYPSSMRAIGASPELILKENANKQEIAIAIAQGHRVSMNNTIYDGTKDGVVRSIIEKLLFEREHFKRIYLDIGTRFEEAVKKEFSKRGLTYKING